MKKTLASFLLAGSLIFLGCDGKSEKTLKQKNRERLDNSKQLIKGTVIEESYQGPKFEKVEGKHIDGLVSQAYSNPTTTVGDSVYTIKMKTDEGKTIILEVTNGYTSKESVRHLLEKGDRVGFTKGDLVWKNIGWGDFLGHSRDESGFYTGEQSFVTRYPRNIKKLD